MHRQPQCCRLQTFLCVFHRRQLSRMTWSSSKGASSKPTAITAFSTGLSSRHSKLPSEVVCTQTAFFASRCLAILMIVPFLAHASICLLQSSLASRQKNVVSLCWAHTQICADSLGEAAQVAKEGMQRLKRISWHFPSPTLFGLGFRQMSD